ncbi:VWA domain-containing protein, partial [Vibrio sp. 10N.222.51.C12]
MSDFIFLHPNAFWLLIPILIGAIVVKSVKRHSASQPLMAPHLAAYFERTNGVKHSKRATLISLTVIIVIAMAGPSFQEHRVPAGQTNQARVLVLDMSQSVYANDIKPNRLAQIKYKAQDLLPIIKEGQTGLVAYAGDAYVLSPLTSDSATLKNLIQNLSPDIMPIQGARADLAIEQSITMMKQAGLTQGEILLFSDDLDSQEVSRIQAQLEGTSWTLSVLAFGSKSGAPIPLSDGSLLKNDAGTTVVAKTNFKGMQQVTQINDGRFVTYQSNNTDLEQLTSSDLFSQSTNTSIKANADSQTVVARVNNGIWLLPFALLLILPLFRKGFIFSVPVFTSAFVAMLLASTPSPVIASSLSQWFNNADQNGYQSYQGQDYERAAEEFTQARWQGAAKYQAGDYEGAIQSWQLLNETQDLYNLAHAYAQNGNFDEAIENYEMVIKREPDNAAAKQDLETVKRAQQQQQQ